MCGFVGFTGKIKNKEKIVKSMNEKIIHRGPDSDGFYTDDNIALGFRRLSIIDLDGGTQPIFNEDKSLVIIFNGEIYNFKDLKEDLKKKGHKFTTKTDTEVILHGYEEYGTEILNKLRGMFAFAIWNIKTQELFIARDFFGIKPLYYTIVNDELIFASEIKAILEHPKVVKELNEDALANYLTFQYSVPPETLFKGIKVLLPGSYLTFKSGNINITKYWNPYFKIDNNLTFDECVNKIDEAFLDSVKAHKISDVEVGSFLSSGVDSSVVAACYKGDKAFTVGFDYDGWNEIDVARDLAEKIGVEHYSKVISVDEFWEAIPKVQYHMDLPLADPACISLYFANKLASEHVKVVLSGEGADELFGGYGIYREPLSLARYMKLPKFIRKTLGGIATILPNIKGKSFLIRGSKTVEERFIGNANYVTQKEVDKILKNNIKRVNPMEITKPYYDQIKDYDDITKMQFLDINLWMTGDILLKADKMSMANSIELRVPFLDKYVFDVAKSIPAKYRLDLQTFKKPLREAASRHLPKGNADIPKKGFPTPVKLFLKEDKYYKIVREAFQSKVAEKYFNVPYIVSMLDKEHFSTDYARRKDNSRKIWNIYAFLVWYNMYFKED